MRFGFVAIVGVACSTPDATSPETATPRTEWVDVEIYINEFMTDNESFLETRPGRFDDWIELYNAGSADVDIDGYFISDEEKDPYQIRIEGSLVIDAGGYVLLILENSPDMGPEHIDFRLDRGRVQRSVVGIRPV